MFMFIKSAWSVEVTLELYLIPAGRSSSDTCAVRPNETTEWVGVVTGGSQGEGGHK